MIHVPGAPASLGLLSTVHLQNHMYACMHEDDNDPTAICTFLRHIVSLSGLRHTEQAVMIPMDAPRTVGIEGCRRDGRNFR